MTVDYVFWVRLPGRQNVWLLTIVNRQAGAIRAQTVYEFRDGTQVNPVFVLSGLRSINTDGNPRLGADWTV